MDPKQFLKNSNIQVHRSNPNSQIVGNAQARSTFKELRIGRFKPGLYNVLVNKDFDVKSESNVDLIHILKQKPKGHAQIAPGLTIDLNEIKGIYGRFQVGAIHTNNFGIRGNLDKKFSSVQFSGYMTDGIERKNFSFNVYKNGKIRFSGGFLGSKNLKRQPESLRKYIIDTYTKKEVFLYNDINYNNIGGQFATNANFNLTRIAQENPLKTVVDYTPESSPFLYITYKEHNYILSSKSEQLGAGIVQLQGENDPDNLENAYTTGVELIQKLHELGYTMGFVNKNVNAKRLLTKKEKLKASTCPKPRRPPCKEGFEVRKNPQGYDCCFKIPKIKPSKKTTKPQKNTSITYDKDGIMKIGGRKCERLTKPVLLEVSKKLGIVGIKNKSKKEDICKALDKIEKGNSNYKIDDKLCRELKKDQLIAIAISKGISINDTDTVKVLCQKLQNKKNTPNSPNSLANEMEKALKNKERKNKRAPINKKRRLNEASIKNDLIKLYGKKWINKYGNVMNINKDVQEVKKELNNMEKNWKSVTSNGIIKKMTADQIKKNMVKNWKLDKQQVLKKIVIEKEANKIYGKFGKNVVNPVVNFAMSLPKTPNLNSKKIVDFIKLRRELKQQPPLALNKKRVIPKKPKVSIKPKVIKRPPIKKKTPVLVPPKNKLARRLNFNSNSNSKSNSSNSNSKSNSSNSNSKSKSNKKLLNEIYENFEKMSIKRH